MRVIVKTVVLVFLMIVTYLVTSQLTVKYAGSEYNPYLTDYTLTILEEL